MMLTFRAGKSAARAVFCVCLVTGLSVGACLSLSACSREQQDWRAAEAADTVEGYGQFLEHHPDSELVTAARTRVAQLTEEREWQQASSADTADAYRTFLAQHPNGKWAQEARIRLQNFSLSSLSAQGAPQSYAGAAPSVGAGTASAADRAAAGATAPAPARLASASPGESAAPARSAPATPGELAQPPAPPVAPAATSAAPARLSTAYVSTPRAAPIAVSSVNQPPANSTPPPAAASGALAGYGVQLGAFTSETAANAAWQQLTSHFGAQLSGLAPRVLAANTMSGTLYRLQAQVPDEAQARALCDMLRKQSQACVPVLPH